MFVLSPALTELLQLDVHTGMVVNRLGIPNHIALSSPFLKLHNELLLLATGYSQLAVFDIQDWEYVGTISCGGKRPYVPSSVCFAEGLLVFSTVSNRNIYLFPLEALLTNGQVRKPVKIRLPPKVRVSRILAQPHTEVIVAACSDSLIRVWNVLSRDERTPVVDTSSQDISKKLINSIAKAKNRHGVACINFNEDGGRLLAGDDGGKLFVWRTENLERQ